MICPDCQGAKGHNALSLHWKGYRWLPCNRCGETGSVPDAMVQWIEDGQRLRAWRESQDRSLSEEARRRGMSVLLLSRCELGKEEPVFPAEYSPLVGGVA